MMRELKMIQAGTASGPDNICGHTLRYSAERQGDFQFPFKSYMVSGKVCQMETLKSVPNMTGICNIILSQNKTFYQERKLKDGCI